MKIDPRVGRAKTLDQRAKLIGSAKEEVVEEVAPALCKMCGRDLPPGGTRRIGVCVWCVAESSKVKPSIPRVTYGRSD